MTDGVSDVGWWKLAAATKPTVVGQPSRLVVLQPGRPKDEGRRDACPTQTGRSATSSTSSAT